MKQVLETLKKIDLFSTLDESELQELAAISYLSHYDKGETLFSAGDISSHLMILVDGVVSIFKHDSKGNTVVIGYFNRYAMLAESATLRHTPLPSSSVFHTDGAVLKIALDGFEKILMKNPKLSYEVIQSLLNKVDLLQQNIHFNLAATSKEKILNFYTKNPKLALDLKKYEIASILGITPETLSRGITKLVKEKQLIATATGYKVAESTDT